MKTLFASVMNFINHVVSFFVSRQVLVSQRNEMFRRNRMILDLMFALRPSDLKDAQESLKASQENLKRSRKLYSKEDRLYVEHWASHALAFGLQREINEDPEADNFLSIDFQGEFGEKYTVTIQRAEGKTPGERIAELEKELNQLYS